MGEVIGRILLIGIMVMVIGMVNDLIQTTFYGEPFGEIFFIIEAIFAFGLSMLYGFLNLKEELDELKREIRQVRIIKRGRIEHG